MRKQNFLRTFCIVLAILFTPAYLPSQEVSGHKEKKGRLRIVVTSKVSTQPVSGADVIVRAKDEDYEVSTRTDSQGNASIGSVPRGSLLIQIIAGGWKTWGGRVDFKDDAPIKIALEKDQPEGPSASPTP